MSRSTFSCRTSRRSRASSSRSALVSPSLRLPPSRSACATQLLIDWAVGSNSRDSSSGVRPARTSSTICWRNSGGYGFLVLGIVDSFLHKIQVSTKPGQLQELSGRLHTTPLRDQLGRHRLIEVDAAVGTGLLNWPTNDFVQP